MRTACEAGGEDVVLSSSFNAGSFPGETNFSGKVCVIRGQGQTLDAAFDVSVGGSNSSSVAATRLFSGSGAGSRLEIHGLTLKNGQTSSADSTDSGGAIYAYNADLKFYEVTFEANSASQAGAIYINGGSLITSGTKFKSHVANTYYGGAVYCLLAAVAIYSSTFESNYAKVYGGAIRIDGGSLEIRDTSFESNVANDGGAIYATGDLADVEIHGATFISNSAGYNGGAIFAYKANVEVHTTMFRSNSAANNGGALHVTGGSYGSSGSSTRVKIYTSSFESSSANNVS
jgi:predicted outer membrane repeat protein